MVDHETRQTGESNVCSSVGVQAPSPASSCVQMSTDRSSEHDAIVLTGMPEKGAQATSRTQSLWTSACSCTSLSCFQLASAGAYCQTRTMFSHEPVTSRCAPISVPRERRLRARRAVPDAVVGTSSVATVTAGATVEATRESKGTR